MGVWRATPRDWRAIPRVFHSLQNQKGIPKKKNMKIGGVHKNKHLLIVETIIATIY